MNFNVNYNCLFSREMKIAERQKTKEAKRQRNMKKTAKYQDLHAKQ